MKRLFRILARSWSRTVNENRHWFKRNKRRSTGFTSLASCLVLGFCVLLSKAKE